MKVTPLKFLGVFRAGIIIIIYLIPVTNIPCFMWFLLYLAATLAVELMFAHARPQNLLTGDSIQPRSAAPEVDDASSLWISDDLKSVSPDLSANPSVQELDTANDLDIFRTSDDLFGSDSTDLSALPACENTSSLTDNVLRARGSCDSGYKPPLNLPNKLFQDSELFLQQNIRTAPAGQMQQPARPDEKVYDSWPTIWTGKNEPDETICPTRVFGSSKIPVCSNGITGRVIPLVNTLAQNLENILPYMFECPSGWSAAYCCETVTTRDFRRDEIRGAGNLITRLEDVTDPDYLRILRQIASQAESNTPGGWILNNLGEYAHDGQICLPMGLALGG